MRISTETGERLGLWTVPNLLTLARIAAAPALALPFLLVPRPEADLWALGLFLAAAATDFLDGWLARRLGQESALGRVLDPIADKAMVVIALALVLALYDPRPEAPSGTELVALDLTLSWAVTPPIVLILAREILVSGLREALGPGAPLRVTRLAKWKTAAQMAAIALALAEAPADHLAIAAFEPATAFAVELWISLLGLTALWVAAAITLVTGWDYTAKALTYIREREEP